VVPDSEAEEPGSSSDSSYPPIPVPPPPGLLVEIEEGEIEEELIEIVDHNGHVVDHVEIALGIVMMDPPPAYVEIFDGALEELTDSEGEDV